MNIIIENETQNDVESYYDDIIMVIENTLEFENFSKNVEISVTIVDDETIRELNNKFRKIDKKTDVLSFPLLDDFSNLPEDDVIFLGDIVISIDTAIEQSIEYNHSLQRELTFLTIHSVLHLLGYDHMNDEDEKDMIYRQKEVFKISNISRN